MEKYKRCAKCKEIKTLSSFHKNRQNKDGYHSYCKKCRNFIKRQYYNDICLGYRETKKQEKEKIDYSSLPIAELVAPNQIPKNILINKKLQEI